MPNLQKKTAGEIISGVPRCEPVIDFNAPPINYASIKVPDAELDKAYKITKGIDLVKKENQNPTPRATIDEIIDAEKITRTTPQTSESAVYPQKFSTQDYIPNAGEYGPKTSFIEPYRTSRVKKDKSLISGLIVLILLLFGFIIILQCTKNN